MNINLPDFDDHFEPDRVDRTAHTSQIIGFLCENNESELELIHIGLEIEHFYDPRGRISIDMILMSSYTYEDTKRVERWLCLIALYIQGKGITVDAVRGYTKLFSDGFAISGHNFKSDPSMIGTERITATYAFSLKGFFIAVMFGSFDDLFFNVSFELLNKKFDNPKINLEILRLFKYGEKIF